jgi:hypothetical protein
MHAVALLEAHENAVQPAALVPAGRDDLGLVSRAFRAAVGVSVVGHENNVVLPRRGSNARGAEANALLCVAGRIGANDRFDCRPRM